MIDYEMIKRKAGLLRRKFGTGNIYNVISGLDLSLLEHPMGTEKDSIRAFILKNNRAVTIMLNSDLPDDAVPFILAHEVGHYEMNHLQGASCTCQDRYFSYYTGGSELARKENEANFFAAEYLLDTGETLEILHEYDMPAAAKMLRVPVEFLDFKARLMAYDGLISDYNGCIIVKNSFLADTPLRRNDLIC